MATQHTNAALTSQEQDVATFQRLEDYAWDSDPEFHSGLQAILGSNPSAEQAEHLVLRARCFYFARKNSTPIDSNAYLNWRSSFRSSGISTIVPVSSPAPLRYSPPRLDSNSRNGRDTTRGDKEATAPYPTSFSQTVELITSGDPIPGIKDIPGTVLEGQASRSTTAKRRKPWENEDASAGEAFMGANSVANTA